MSKTAMVLVIASALWGCRRNETAASGATPSSTTPGAQPGAVAAVPAAAAGGGAAQALAVPGQANGTLQQGDHALQDGSLGDDYTVNLTAGQPVTFVVRGRRAIGEDGNMDAYAVLLFNNQEVAHDDDGAGGPDGHDARVVYTPTASGPHTLRVTTFGGGMHQGAYEVQAWPGANNDAH